MVTVECVILGVCPPYLETSQFTGSLLGRHISSVFASFPSYCSVMTSRCASRGLFHRWPEMSIHTAGAFSSPQFFIEVTLYSQPISTQFLWHAFCDKLCGRNPRGMPQSGLLHMGEMLRNETRQIMWQNRICVRADVKHLDSGYATRYLAEKRH
jgi:hypothetical protein